MLKNVNQFSFILCVNHQQYEEECLRYIEALSIPDGYTYDIIRICEAESMAQGYQAAMQQSEAKYKIYLHQDVFLINKNILQDILDLFSLDDSIGMIGVVGREVLPKSAIMWEGGLKRCGKLYSDLIHRLVLFEGIPIEGSYLPVQAIDGLLMITQYDVPWREDLFQGWDFYDISQSMEFLRNGNQVVVPKMQEPWCLHDKDIVNLKKHEHWRQVFLKEYGREIGLENL